ncbi:hypothetical protein PRIPAC_71372 [Pristionchus pacificus]|uniref:Uncharacterized protein n=1 Tax=Pristionchus pacificus TaxID=54126 RepID=A0A2A6C8U8_PRIPA|nr:hypothetical protein PRIPAC_71372 [Pristionchus pacificus]|eukprot:PDM74537.1 hypothetical protein PRIPAC_41893 [Pristionchus pacificus]
MQWSVALEGGPRRVNHAAVLLGDNHIYSFGGYCSTEKAQARGAPIDIHVLNATTYKWQRVWSEQEQRHMGTPPRRHRRGRSEVLDEVARRGFRLNAQGRLQGVRRLELGSVDSDDEPEMAAARAAPAADEVQMAVSDHEGDSDEYEDARRDASIEDEEAAADAAMGVPEADFVPFGAYHQHGLIAEEMEEDTKSVVPYYRYGHTVVAYDGIAYLWGGRNDESGACDLLHAFNPVDNSWRTLATKGRIPPARDGHSAVVHEGKMIVFGGFEEQDQRFSQETFIFDFATATWTEMATTGDRPAWRDFHTAVVIGDDMFVFGGRCDIMGQYHSTRDVYDEQMRALNLKTNRWRVVETKGSIPSGRRSHSAFSYSSKMYVIGGFNGALNEHYNDLYEFDPATEVWTKLETFGEPPSERRRQCTLVANDRVYLFGGTKPSHDSRLQAIPNNNAQGSLTDLSDLHVLDLKPTLYQIAAMKICCTRGGRALFRKRMMFLPGVIRDDLMNRIDPALLAGKPMTPATPAARQATA